MKIWWHQYQFASYAQEVPVLLETKDAAGSATLLDTLLAAKLTRIPSRQDITDHALTFWSAYNFGLTTYPPGFVRFELEAAQASYLGAPNWVPAEFEIDAWSAAANIPSVAAVSTLPIESEFFTAVGRTKTVRPGGWNPTGPTFRTHFESFDSLGPNNCLIAATKTRNNYKGFPNPGSRIGRVSSWANETQFKAWFTADGFISEANATAWDIANLIKIAAFQVGEDYHVIRYDPDQQLWVTKNGSDSETVCDILRQPMYNPEGAYFGQELVGQPTPPFSIWYVPPSATIAHTQWGYRNANERSRPSRARATGFSDLALY